MRYESSQSIYQLLLTGVFFNPKPNLQHHLWDLVSHEDTLPRFIQQEIQTGCKLYGVFIDNLDFAMDLQRANVLVCCFSISQIEVGS
jgi:hypothetical protein